MDEMKVALGVRDSSKKYLMRSTWTGHVEQWEMKNWQREQMPRKWKGNEGEEDQNGDVDCINSDLERVGDEWRQK